MKSAEASKYKKPTGPICNPHRRQVEAIISGGASAVTDNCQRRGTGTGTCTEILRGQMQCDEQRSPLLDSTSTAVVHDATSDLGGG